MPQELFAEMKQHRVEPGMPLPDRLEIGMTTREGGISEPPRHTLNMGLHVNDDPAAVLENRSRLGKAVDWPISRWVMADQVHKTHIQQVTRSDLGRGVYHYEEALPGTDGMFTTEHGILLAMCYADCVPLYIYDKSLEVIGIAHAGWKGTVGDIAGKMIRAMADGTDKTPGEFYAYIGPSIGVCCYEVDERVTGAVDAFNIENRKKVLLPGKSGRDHLDLKALNRLLFLRAGVPEENILASDYCTSCENEIFFSHRKENGETGRMISYIGIRQEETE